MRLINTFLPKPIQIDSSLSTLSSSNFHVFPLECGAFLPRSESRLQLLSSRDTYILFAFVFFFHAAPIFFKVLSEPCDRRSENMVMASTLHATSPRSGLGEPTHEFLEILAALTPRYKQEKSRVGNQCFLQCMCSQPVLRKFGELLSPVVQNPLRLFAYFFCKFLLIDYPINTAFPVGGKVES